MRKLFILGGQSNMVGCGTTSELPDNWPQPVAGVRYLVDGTEQPLADNPTFGPEIGLAHALRGVLPNDDIVLLKVALSGANMYYDWDPDAREGGPEDNYRGPLYPALIDALAACRDNIDEIAGMFWMQGERDSVFAHMAQAYETHLSAFIDRVRADLNVPALPFVMALVAPRIRDLDAAGGRWRHPFRTTVQAAQRRIAERIPVVALVDTLDLPQRDNLHFDTAGQLLLGERFAIAWQQLTA